MWISSVYCMQSIALCFIDIFATTVSTILFSTTILIWWHGHPSHNKFSGGTIVQGWYQMEISGYLIYRSSINVLQYSQDISRSNVWTVTLLLYLLLLWLFSTFSRHQNNNNNTKRKNCVIFELLYYLDSSPVNSHSFNFMMCILWGFLNCVEGVHMYAGHLLTAFCHYPFQLTHLQKNI